MQRTISSAARKRLALVAFTSLWLGACGGGGSDVTTAAPSSAGSSSPVAAGPSAPASAPASASGPVAPVPSPSPAGSAPAPASGTPVAQGPAPTPSTETPPPPALASTLFDPVLVATNTSLDVAPVTARLTGGGSVVIWVENKLPMARMVTAAGVPGEPFAITPDSTLAASNLAVTAAPDGGFLVLWTDEVERAVSQFSGRVGVEARRFAADGTALWQTRVGSAQVMGRPMARATANGFVIAWTFQQIFTMPEQGFMQLLAADGSFVGPSVEIGRQDTFPFQHQLSALPLQDGSILAVWSQGNNARQVYMRRYDANLAPIGAAVPVAGTETGGPALLDAQVLATGDVVLAWGLAPPQPHPVNSVVVGTDGTLRSAIHTVTPDRDVDAVRVVPLGAGGYGVVWDVVDANYRLLWATLWLQRFANAGAVIGDPQQLDLRYLNSASATTGATSSAGRGFDVAGGPDGHFVAVLNRIQASTYLMGR